MNQCQQHAAQQEREQHTPVLPFEITAQEMKDLLRFYECACDNEGYDVPKERMKRLAQIGLLRRCFGNVFEPTTFGLAVINGDFAFASELTKQRDELLAVFLLVIEEMERRGEGCTPGNAPGHCHDIPGVWDSDNSSDIAGKPCAWCATWNKAKELRSTANAERNQQ